MKEGRGAEGLTDILTRLVEYTRSHFSTEERLFEKYGYPSCAAHKALHDDLTREALDLQEQFKSGKSFISVKVSESLYNWLVKHIMGADKGYSDFFRSVGLS